MRTRVDSQHMFLIRATKEVGGKSKNFIIQMPIHFDEQIRHNMRSYKNASSTSFIECNFSFHIFFLSLGYELLILES